MLIQSFLMVVGTITMLVVLSVRLSLIVVIFLAIMFVLLSSADGAAGNIFRSSRSILDGSTALWKRWWPDRRLKRYLTMSRRILRSFAAEMRSCAGRRPARSAIRSMMVPTIVSLSYANYAVSACVGRSFYHCRTFRHRQPGILSCLCASECDAAESVYKPRSTLFWQRFPVQKRIFEMMDEPAEIDEGTVTMCPVYTSGDGTVAKRTATPDSLPGRCHKRRPSVL